MASERTERQVQRLLDEAEEAITQRDWAAVREIAVDILALDPDSVDGRSFLGAAERRLARDPAVPPPSDVAPATTNTPASFANGRYQVKRFLGEGGKKRVYLAHDTMLARDVAFALIKAEGLDAEGRERITRVAQAMGKLGTHPHIVAVFDIGVEGGSEAGQPSHDREGVPPSQTALSGGTPYLVTELMSGGDIETLLEKASEHRLP